MSKSNSQKYIYQSPAMNTRNSSRSMMKDLFSSNTTATEEEFYDRRTYYDSASRKEYSPWMYSKTLSHNSVTGFPEKEHVDTILKAVETGTLEDENAMALDSNSVRKIEGVYNGKSFSLLAGDPSVFSISPSLYYPINSRQAMFEMMEVYARCVLRDMPFSTIKAGTDPAVVSVLTALNAYSNAFTTNPVAVSGNIEAAQLFCGGFPGTTIGPYVSQLLVHPYDHGNLAITQKYQEESDSVASSTMEGWLNIQNGITPPGANKTGFNKYIYNGRMGGSKVHNDALYQCFLSGALVCLDNGITLEAEDNGSAKSTAWTSGGEPSLFAAIAQVALYALRTAWMSKFSCTMRVRPEVFAQRLQFGLVGDSSIVSAVPGLVQLVENSTSGNSILSQIRTLNGNDTVLLRLIYPEGSPTHPSLPAGHATVAGACVTVIKAMLKLRDDSGNPIPWVADGRQSMESTDGDTLTQSAYGDESQMTVIGELNKLGANISGFRDFAGVHYRADTAAGMKLGEDLAVQFLKDVAREYGETTTGVFQGFNLTKFSGEQILIK